MEPDTNKTKANELLTNWSKWLITINFLAATGCIVALKTAGEGTARTGVFFFLAIFCFSLSVVCSTLFVFMIAKQGLRSPAADTSGIIWLANLQWVLFTTGLLFVLVWIAILSRIF